MIDLAILSAGEATEKLRGMGMRISAPTLINGIEQGLYPFGIVIRTEKGSPVCQVFERKLMEWAKEYGYERK